MRKRGNYPLKSSWPDFHFSFFCGIEVSFPVKPIDAICVWRVLSVAVNAVQVWLVTTFVPPSTFISYCTIWWRRIIIAVHGRKGCTMMISQRIPCSSWKQKIWKTSQSHDHHFDMLDEEEYSSHCGGAMQRLRNIGSAQKRLTEYRFATRSRKTPNTERNFINIIEERID